MRAAQRRTLLVAIGLAVASLLVSLTAVPRAAADPAAGAGVGNPDPSKWPAYLKWAIPDSPQFNAAFMKPSSPTNPNGCLAGSGGDAYQYTMRYLDNVGQIFQAIGHSSGKSVLNVANVGNVRMDIPQLTSVNWAGSVGGGSDMPTLVGPPDVTPVDLTTGRAVCGKEWAQFGQQDPTTAFGFGYYNQPDAGSITYINATMKVFPGVANTWNHKDPAGTFDPRNLNNYCDAGNPYCLTAAFLHCDATGVVASLVQACHNWNYNVTALNVLLEQTVIVYGTVSNPQAGAAGHIQTTAYPIKDLYGRSHQVAAAADVLATPSQDTGTQAAKDARVKLANQGYYSGWLLATDGQAYTDWANSVKRVGTVLVVGLAVTFGAAAAVGAWWLGFGLVGILAAGASVAALTVFAGTIACGSELAKCLAQATSQGFAYMLGLVPSAATALHYAPMTSASWSSTLNTVAGISLGLLLALFMLNLLFAVIRRRPVIAIESLGGVLSWVILLAIGGSILTLLVDARNGATEALGGTSGVLAGLANRVVGTINTLGATAGFGGWLLIALIAAVGMLLALIVYLVLWVSALWLPLVIGILILQAAGLAAPGLAAGKWFKRGFATLWMLLITAPIIVFVWRLGSTQAASAGSFASLVGALAVLALCAAAPMLVAGMFGLGVSGRLGAGAALLGAGLAAFAAGKGLKGLAGAASAPGRSSEQLMNNQLASGGARGAGGNVATELAGGGGPGGVSRGMTAAAGPSLGGQGTSAASGGGAATTDPWAAPGASGGAPTGRHGAPDAAATPVGRAGAADSTEGSAPRGDTAVSPDTQEESGGGQVADPREPDGTAAARPSPTADTDDSSSSVTAPPGSALPSAKDPEQRSSQTSPDNAAGTDQTRPGSGVESAAQLATAAAAVANLSADDGGTGTEAVGAAAAVAAARPSPGRPAGQPNLSAPGGTTAGASVTPAVAGEKPSPAQGAPPAVVGGKPPSAAQGQPPPVGRPVPPAGGPHRGTGTGVEQTSSMSPPAASAGNSAGAPAGPPRAADPLPENREPAAAAGNASEAGSPWASNASQAGQPPAAGGMPADANVDGTGQAPDHGRVEPGWARHDRSWDQLPDTEDPQR